MCRRINASGLLLFLLLVLLSGCSSPSQPAEPMQIVTRQGDTVTIAHRYSAQDDMWIVFDYSGPNRLYGFSQWRLAPNDEQRVQPDMKRESVLLQNAISDWVGPYIVKAQADGTGETNGHFTGGYHAYNGNDTGSPTARTVEVHVWADGKLLLDGQTFESSSVRIEVVNRIQGYNTKLADGTGREIVQETIRYDIAGGQVNVEAGIEALEPIVIERYYGVQTMNVTWNDTIAYQVGDEVVAAYPVKGNSDSGERAAHPALDRIELSSDRSKPVQHRLRAWLDRSYGLGTMKLVADHRPAAFTYTYGKSYFLQIVDMTLTLAKGQRVSWRGGYLFYVQEQPQ